jgi:hypothetical protein
MTGSRKKILGSGGTSYPTYLDPLVPIFALKASRIGKDEW